MRLLSTYYVPASVPCPGEQMQSETAPAALHELAHGPVSQGGGAASSGGGWDASSRGGWDWRVFSDVACQGLSNI